MIPLDVTIFFGGMMAGAAIVHLARDNRPPGVGEARIRAIARQEADAAIYRHDAVAADIGTRSAEPLPGDRKPAR